jgi:shikimate kinase
VAHLLGFGFVDLDTLIEEHERQSIRQIFAEKGEDYFRSLEASLLQQLQPLANHVITVGGGTFVARKNIELLSQLGVTVWLHCETSEIARRLARDPEELAKRPLLAELASIADRKDRQHQVLRRLTDLYEGRSKFVEQAKFYLNVSFTSPDEGARSINGLLRKKSSLKMLKKEPFRG